IRFQNPDIIICTGVDFHLIHTLIIFFVQRILRGRKFYWWSHAGKGHQGRLGFLLRRIVYKNSSGIMTYNSEGKNNLLAMGISMKRIEVVNNSVNRIDYGFLNYDLFQKKSNPTFSLIYSGRVSKSKKVDMLIKALGKIKFSHQFNFKCYIIGDGDIDLLKLLSQENNVYDNIHFVGAKYGQDNHRYFLESDLFVYPGGIGLSILHAMSFGLPVITTDDMKCHGPEFELMLPGINGSVFEDNSIEDLAEKIMYWKTKIENSRDEIIQSCINRIRNLGYLPEEVGKKVVEFILEDSY
ncbi:glycosyltransferase family 4 protein, partial [Bacteroidota bacterium]